MLKKGYYICFQFLQKKATLRIAFFSAESEGLEIPVVAMGVLASSNSQSQPVATGFVFRSFLRQQAAAEVPQSEGLEIPVVATGVDNFPNARYQGIP